MTDWPFLWGVVGGALAEFLKLYQLRETLHERRPVWLGSRWYWALTIGMVLLGGFVCLVYTWSGLSLNIVLSINIGASAPLLLQGLLRQAPRIDPTASD